MYGSLGWDFIKEIDKDVKPDDLKDVLVDPDSKADEPPSPQQQKQPLAPAAPTILPPPQVNEALLQTLTTLAQQGNPTASACLHHLGQFFALNKEVKSQLSQQQSGYSNPQSNEAMQ